MLPRKLIKSLRAPAGKAMSLKDFDPKAAIIPDLAQGHNDSPRADAKTLLARNLAELADAQELLWANDIYSVLVVLQAMDAAGKDGTIKHVMSGINPQGCQVFSFKVPSAEEQDHNFLWRYARALPERGRIGIFNRSYYEEVLVVKVHPEVLAREKLPAGKRHRKFWKERYSDINHFEHHLVRNGTLVLKFFLNLSREEQKKRFLDRLDDTAKQWKFSAADVAERQYWDAYMQAYEEAIAATSTAWAPWYIIPADNKWAARALVAEVLTSSIRRLELKPPMLSAEAEQGLAAARQQLMNE